MAREKKIIAIIAFISLTIISTVFSFIESTSHTKKSALEDSEEIIVEDQENERKEKLEDAENITISELANMVKRTKERKAYADVPVSEGSAPPLETEPELEGGTWELLEISNIECLDVLLPLKGQQHILKDIDYFFKQNSISENKISILPESIVNEEKYLEFEFLIEDTDIKVIVTYFHQGDIFVFEFK